MAPYILAADDDEYVRVLIETKLGSAYDLKTVADGDEVWELLTDPDHPRPDLCILDVMMPELDGFATLERLRGHAELADIPVMMLTSRGREDDVMRALDAGANDFVTKPFSPSELAARVEKLLES
ncbi:response regulator transcription factor [Halorubrum sp. PV6]|uniref:response regulator transcription factor n=1 Tax=Halorubrum sp. PV6 TaxID=634157 RepID=UPI000F84F0DA|nr:response regulator transcription factor [Halorubrum sp. PV6]AZQ15111.1 response regulator [Halorubrum sp. PV6]